ncbi:MAG TPA: nitroreductase family protein [Firmicutes bacterium]|nr:nitroreductase family protein [Bacillota bacterium]
MEFRELVMRRKSIRKYLPDPVDQKDIYEMLELATRAANAGNQQMWRFFVIQSKDVLSRMAQAVSDATDRLAARVGQSERASSAKKWALFFQEAPCVIAVATQRYDSVVEKMLVQAGYSQQQIDDLRVRPDLQSIGGCIQLLLLAAEEKGYGACWMTAPLIARPELEEILKIKPPLSLAALIPLGRPAEQPPLRPRKPVQELVTYV